MKLMKAYSLFIYIYIYLLKNPAVKAFFKLIARGLLFINRAIMS